MGHHRRDDATRFEGPNLPARFTHGGAGRQDVVHEHDGRTGQVGARPDGESAAHVFPALGRRRQILLGRRPAAAFQPAVLAADSQPGCEASGEHFALIEAAPAMPQPMQGDRQHDVRGERLKQRGQLLRPEPAEDFRQALAVRLFHAQHNVAQQSVVGPQAESAIEGQRAVAAGRTAERGVDKRAHRAGTAQARRPAIILQLGRTIVTDCRLIDRLNLPADPADSRQQEMKQAPAEIAAGGPEGVR